jgi:hypothetical protein
MTQFSCVTQPAENSVTFGSRFNDVFFALNGYLNHVGDIFVQDGGMHMVKGIFKVLNLNFRRAHLASFFGSDVKLGAARPGAGMINMTGQLQCIDTMGTSFLSINTDGHVQSRVLLANNVTLKSDVS